MCRRSSCGGLHELLPPGTGPPGGRHTGALLLDWHGNGFGCGWTRAHAAPDESGIHIVPIGTVHVWRGLVGPSHGSWGAAWGP
eukprot:5705462-Alexandrium_andersonii.AAC.1